MRCPRCFRKLAPGAACPADGARAADEVATRVEVGAPPAVPGWRIGGLIAAGGQAAVWRAVREGQHEDEDDAAVRDRAVRDTAVRALKVAHGPAPELAHRFAEEAAALAAIGAPAVAATFDRGVLADRRPYLAMELVEGDTLGELLARAPAPPPIDDVVAWAAGLADGLAAIHAAGYVHRDLKPDNVVRQPDGAIRILDLGLAQRIVDGELAPIGQVVGTPLYLAPEQLRGEEVDPRADLYALGAILFEALTLRPPFAGDRAAIELGHLALRAPRVASLRPVPARLDELVAACL
ncbi:MAG TPA: serine/threonine-protein kinase, partial [Kofleriaceae bacterium]|nr:serine/threonine-protein kinase [Kofleriaceae bacterium]